MKVEEFAEGVEKLIDPINVGSIHHAQKKLQKLPVWLQKKLVTGAAKKADKMGFVVEPYAFFLFYEITDPEKTEGLLPEGFVPVKSRAFEGDDEKYYGIVSIFRVHTSAFWGARAEFYMIAKNTKTDLVSWVILDYVSDTISYDGRYGLRAPSASRVVLTTTCEGEFLANFKNEEDGDYLICQANLEHHKMRLLDEKLWIDGNTSIAYGREVGEKDGDLFSLTFLPNEMKEAWEIPLADVKKVRVSWLPEVFSGKLDKAVCFPFAQHMLSDSPGNSTHYGSRAALKKAAESVDFSKINLFK